MKTVRSATKVIALILTALMLVLPVSADYYWRYPKTTDTYAAQTTSPSNEPLPLTLERLSNPTAVSGEADGLTVGGDRENSYAWCTARLGDYIYIGSNRNIQYFGVLNFLLQNPELKIDLTAMNSAIDVITNGEIYTGSSINSLQQSKIFRYNVITGEMDVYLDSATTDIPELQNIFGFRSCITYKDAVYMNATSLANGSRLIKITNYSDTPEVVYHEPAGSFMRAMAVGADGETLYIGGTVNTVNLPAANVDIGINIYKYTGEAAVGGGNIGLDLIADYRDFIGYEDNEIISDGGYVWELAEYNGELYFTLMTKLGAIIYKGHKAAADEDANAHGWVWQEYVGLNGTYQPGFGNPENYAISLFYFKNELYFLTFSNVMDAEINAASGLFKAVNGDNVDLNLYFESLKDVEAVLDNETSIFRLTKDGELQMVLGDENKCPEGIVYKAVLGAGFNNDEFSTTNYSWRAAEYNGEFYVGTMDSYSIYKYLTKLTNGELFGMNSDEFISQLKYVVDFISLLKNSDSAVSAPPSDDSASYAMNGAPTMYGVPTTYGAPASFNLPEYATSGITDNLSLMNGMLDTNADAATATEMLKAVKVTIPYMQFFRISLNTALKFVKNDKAASVISAVDSILEVMQKVDVEGVERYIRVSNIVAANKNPGFELYRTSDGVNYTSVTLDGFGDEYNYGCRTLLSCEDGLYVGTANPFYGAQLYKITTAKTDAPAQPAAEESLTTNLSSIVFSTNKRMYYATANAKLKAFTFTYESGNPDAEVYLNNRLLDGNDGSVDLKYGVNVVKLCKRDTISGIETVYTFIIFRSRR